MITDRPKIIITPSLCRAARALLGWKQLGLAEKGGVSIGPIREFEADAWKLHKNNARAIQRASEDAGIAFTNGDRPGLKLTPPKGRPRSK